MAILPDGKGGRKEYHRRADAQPAHQSQFARRVRARDRFHVRKSEDARSSRLNRAVDDLCRPAQDRVESLEYPGRGTGYDLTEPVTHHFVANGIVVHNCSEYMFLDDTACNLAALNLLRFYDHADRQVRRRGLQPRDPPLDAGARNRRLHGAVPSPSVAQKSYDFRTLGLGYANLGALLDGAGHPLRSPAGRAQCGALSAIMHAERLRHPREMARRSGRSPGTRPTASNAARHPQPPPRRVRRTASEYEGLTITPVGIDPHHCPADLLEAAARDRTGCSSWRGARLPQRPGHVIAPTGTIGLVMDCDTTGIEPDFALVKFKKLAGGGYFKIINQSVPPALARLGYRRSRSRTSSATATGAATLAGCPHINPETLKARGFTDESWRRSSSHCPARSTAVRVQPLDARRRVPARTRSGSPTSS